MKENPRNGENGQGAEALNPKGWGTESAPQHGDSVANVNRARDENREAIVLVIIVICGFLIGLSLLIYMVLTGL